MNTEPTNQSEGAEASTSGIREIYKNGWLKKIPSDRRPGPFSKSPKAEKIWVVFCVHEEKEPFLEYYENRRSAYSHNSLHSYDLRQCLHISPTILIQEDDHEFAVTLGSQVLRLAAPTQELMVEWLDVLGNKLRELGILQLKDNVYSREPTSPQSQGRTDTLGSESSLRTSFLSPEGTGSSTNTTIDGPSTSGRDPNSPLPPIPLVSPSSQGISVIQAADPPVTVPAGTVSYVRNPGPSSHTLPPASSQRSPALDSQASNSVFSFDFVASSLYESTGERSAPVSPSGTLYEPLYRPAEHRPPRPSSYMHPGSMRPNRGNAQIARRRSESEVSRPHGLPVYNPQGNRSSGNSTFSITPGLSDPQLQAESSTPPPIVQALPLEEGPPPYEPINPQSSTTAGNNYPVFATTPTALLLNNNNNNNLGHNVILNQAVPRATGSVLSLKELQVLSLRREMAHRGGVRLMLRKKDCVGAVALVEAFNTLWIVGWKQKDHPLLHNTFHIGDKVLTIAGQTATTIQDAQKAFKSQALLVEFVVQRVPYGRVFAIKRDFEGHDLGIIRDGNTAEIKEVCENGLVARAGLPAKSPTMDGHSLCSWTLTEVNGRPLNLFFKDNQVQERLNAVGRDISILVQPTELVRALRKQLKGIRSYKDYIVQ